MNRRSGNNQKNKNKNRNNALRIRIRLGVFLCFLIILFGGIFAVKKILDHKSAENHKMSGTRIQPALAEQNHGEGNSVSAQGIKEDAHRQELMAQAAVLAASYDYDSAIALLKSLEGYESDEEIKNQIEKIQSLKDSCVPVNMEEVIHVFYHSLVVDPKRAFANQETDSQAAGNNQWMTTVTEFQKIIQEMYDRGYVIVSIHDLMDVSTNEEGNTIYEPAKIMLPPGKRAYVLSQDDLSYYHCYDKYGFAAKMVLDEENKPVCEYIQEDGTTVRGLMM